MSNERMVHVVDDDAAVRRSLGRLLQAAGYRPVLYETPRAVLDAAPGLASGCLLIDVGMPGMDGLELQAHLNRLGCRLPVIVMTGLGDVQTAVQAMKGGAVDFIEKPFTEKRLMDAVEAASTGGDRQAGRDIDRQVVEAARRLAALSRREREVLNGLLAGRPNKTIASDLGISVRTVEVHRARMHRRLGTRTVAEALQLAVIASLMPEGPHSDDTAGGRHMDI
ncbi:MAG: fixJ [Rhodospirillales bacterium]|nr:fixJ [Rhodospirillales bacterium]